MHSIEIVCWTIEGSLPRDPKVYPVAERGKDWVEHARKWNADVKKI
jgi:hypothetical protein